MKKILVTLALLTSFFAAHAAGEDVRFEAALESNRVSIGNPIYMYLTLYGEKDVNVPEMPPINGLQIKYVGPFTKISVVNGRVSQSVKYTYLVIPRKEGEYKIGPFFVETRGEVYKAEAVELSVSRMPQRPATVSGPVSSAVSSANSRTMSAQQTQYGGNRIFLVMDVEKNRLYINEVVPVTIKVYVDALGLKDIEYPTYSHEGFSVDEFSEPERTQEVRRGARYDVLVFRQNLFGIKEGDYVIGPAHLRCKMVVKRAIPGQSAISSRSVFDDDFFKRRFGSDVYPVELEADAVPITVLPFPEEGRPSGFQGAVGSFGLEVSVEPVKAKVGDPITLRMTVSGSGSLDTVTAPLFKPTDDIKTYEPRATKKGNRKIYEQVIIPKTDKVTEIPEVSFTFFNPVTERYMTVQKGPFPVEVVKQPESEQMVKMVSMPGVEQIFYPQEEIGSDIIHIKENAGRLCPEGPFLCQKPLFWAGQFMLLALAMGFYGIYKRRERILTDKGYARFLKAPRKARAGMARARACLGHDNVLLFYDAVFKTLQEYLGNRFNLPKGSVTGQIIENRLKPAGCDERILEMLRSVFSGCEMARYAPLTPGKHEEVEMLEKVKKIIDYLEKTRLKENGRRV